MASNAAMELHTSGGTGSQGGRTTQAHTDNGKAEVMDLQAWAWSFVMAGWGINIGWLLREHLMNKQPPTIEHFLGQTLLETCDNFQLMNKFAGRGALVGQLKFTRNDKRLVCTITEENQ